MPTPHARPVLRLAAALAALALAAAAPAAAEPAAAPRSEAELIRLEVRPGHEAEMERFLTRLAEAARRTGAPVRWRAHRRVDGERPLYVLVLQADTAAELDAWGGLTASATLERAYGAEEAKRLLALREAALEGVQRERFAAAPALSFEE
jgi:hypothetical protein